MSRSDCARTLLALGALLGAAGCGDSAKGKPPVQVDAAAVPADVVSADATLKTDGPGTHDQAAEGGPVDVAAEAAPEVDAGSDAAEPVGPLVPPWSLVTVRPFSAPDGGAPALAHQSADGLNVQLEAAGAGVPPGSSMEDGLTLAAQTREADVEVVARVDALQGCTNPDALVGLMLRDSGQPYAAYALTALTGRGTATAQVRGSQGQMAQTLREDSGFAPPTWVRLTRVGAEITAAYSRDGVTWVSQTRTVGLATRILVGLFVAAGDGERTCTASFSRIVVGPPAGAGMGGG